MKTMRSIRAYVLAAVVAALCIVPSLALAQVQENIDLGAVATSGGVYGANGLFSSGDLVNSTNKGIQCQFNQRSTSGSPSSVFAILSKDAASGTYDTLISTTVTNNPNTYLTIYPGMQTSSLPTNWSGLGVHLTRVFQVQVTLNGSGTTSNFTIGCNLLN